LSAYPLEFEIRKLSSELSDEYFVLGIFDSDRSENVKASLLQV